MIEIRKGDWKKVLHDVGDVDLFFTSPPYNIGSKSPRKDGFRKKGQYDPKSYGGITGYQDNLPEDEYQDQQVKLLEFCRDRLSPNGTIAYNHKPRRKDGKMIHPMSWISLVDGLDLMEEVIWDRGSTHNHSNKLMWPTTERIYVLKLEGGSYSLLNHQTLPQRSDVWRIPLTPRPADGHPAPFTLDLAKAVILAWSNAGDLVCDPYSGSGTTALACAETARRFVGSELDRKFWKRSKERVLLAGNQTSEKCRSTNLDAFA